MGAGCFYTNSVNNTKAAWIDIDRPDDGEDNGVDYYSNLKIEIHSILKAIGYSINSFENISNDLFEIKLKSTPYGDGIIIYIEPINGCYQNIYNLAMANHHRAERRIWRALQKAGYKLNIATGGYTSKVLEEIK